MTLGSKLPILKLFAEAFERDSVTKINVESDSTINGLHFLFLHHSPRRNFFFDSPGFHTPLSQFFQI